MTSDYARGFHSRPAQGNLSVRLVVVVLLWCLSLSSAFADTAASDHVLADKKILILYSYFASTPAYVATTTPLLTALLDGGVKADNLHQEYLDLGRLGSPEYRRTLREFLVTKYGRSKLDLIVTLHGAAQQFVLRDCKDLWPEAQLLSLLAPNTPEAPTGRKAGVQLLSLDFAGTLRLALDMFPQSNRVVFVTGSGPPELKYVEQAKAAFKPWQGKLAFDYTVGLSLDEIVKRVANLPSGTIVLVSALITDGRGANLVVAEASKDVAEAANAPAFGFYDSVFGTVIIGGSMVSFGKAGAYAGKVAVAILEGKTALADPPVPLPLLPPEPIFDWPQIERWRGQVARLPETSIFLNRPPTLWSQHKAAVISTILVILLLTGLVSGLLVQLQRRKRAEKALRKSEALFHNYFDIGQMGMAITSIDMNWLNVNRRLCEMLGYTSEELAKKSWAELTHPDDLEPDVVQFRALLSGERNRYEMDKRLIHKGGNIVYTHLAVACQRKTDKSVEYFMYSIQDITERKLMEEQVRQMAFYDKLTNLPNRRLLEDRMIQVMAASKRSGMYGALMFIDLDNFKPLNDAHGHEMGDLLLIEVANRLRTCVREVDTVSRFGGDEFVVLLNELDTEKDESTSQAKVVSEKIRSSLSEPYLLAIRREMNTDTTVEHRCTASIGVALFFNHEASQEEVFRRADAAMYHAKEAGRNLIRFYDAQT